MYKIQNYHIKILPVILILTSLLFGTNRVVLSDNLKSKDLNHIFEFYEDKNDNITIENILSYSLKSSIKFEPLEGNTNFGYTKSSIWLTFQVKNDTKSTQQAFALVFNLPNIQNITFVQVSENDSIVKKIKTGIVHPISSRDYQDSKFVFTLPVPRNETHRIYIKIKSSASIMTDAKIYSIPEYLKLSTKQLFLSGIFSGIVLISVFYFLFIYIKLKDKSLLFLALATLSFLLFHLSFKGFLQVYIIPDLYFLNSRIILVSNAIILTFYILFTYYFLDIKSQFHKIARLFKILLFFSLFVTFFSFFTHYIIITQIISILFLLFFSLSIPAAFIVLIKGYKPAKFFLLSLLVLMLALVYRIAILFNVFNLAPEFAETYKLAILGVIVFFVQALSQRITLIQSEQKKSEIKFQKSEEKFRLFVEKTNEGILIMNKDLILEYANPEASKLFGIAPHVLIGNKITELIENQANKQIIDNFNKKRWGQDPTTQKEFQIIKKDGEIRNVEISTTFTEDSENNKIILVHYKDITEKKQMEEMLIQSEKMMSVGGLAAGMAHEINNPLAGIMQNATVIVNRLTKKSPKNLALAKKIGLDYDKMIEYLEQRNIIKMATLIKETALRASEIVSNMLSFSKKSESIFKEVDISTTIDDTINLLKNDYDMNKHYDFKTINIIKNYDENLPMIEGHESKLKQVFMNILKNGAEAMGEEGPDIIHQFIINVSQDYKFIILEIENNGPPIQEEIKHRIFEPFFTTKGEDKGTGLGLSISYFIITKDHGGELFVKSDESFGTRFIIKLPIDKN